MTAAATATLLFFMLSANADENAPAPPQTTATLEPYPTATVADYVIGCMLSNGASAVTLSKCSCSFDYIASQIPFHEYEKVETLMRMQQVPGQGRAGAVRSSNWAKDSVAHFKEVQAESTLRCF